MATNPLVTIGIINYNYSQFLISALESAVYQTYPNIEVIILDDCSTDDSVQLIKGWISKYSGARPIRFLKNTVNLGLTKNSNLILSNACGVYFQPLDADDILLPNKIMRQVELLEFNKTAAFIYSNAHVIDENGTVSPIDYLSRIHYDSKNMPSGNVFKDLLHFNFISMPSVLINTQKARDVGGFDESLRVQDYYMWLKLAENHEVLYLDGICAKYRVHKNSMSHSDQTNPRFEDSVITLKHRYLSIEEAEVRKVIKKNIQNSSVYLYMHNFPSAKKWCTISFELSPGIKTLVYLLVTRLNIPYTYFTKLKKLIPKQKLLIFC